MRLLPFRKHQEMFKIFFSFFQTGVRYAKFVAESYYIQGASLQYFHIGKAPTTTSTSTTTTEATTTVADTTTTAEVGSDGDDSSGSASSASSESSGGESG